MRGFLMESRTINIPTEALENFKNRVEKVNKKADKIGSEPIVITSISNPFQQKYHEGNKTFVRNILTVEYQQPDIRIKGYSLVGMISRDPTGTIQINNYNMNNFKDYQNPDFTRCDHCNTKHQRNHLVVLKDKKQQELVVGKSCLKDFMGVVPSTYYKFVNEIHELHDDETYPNNGFTPAYPVLDVLSHTFDIASRNGFVKASDDVDNVPTYLLVQEAILAGKSVSEDAKEKAETGINIIKEMKEEEIYNDYMFNIHQILKNKHVMVKKIAMAVSSYIAIKKILDKRSNENGSNKSNIHIGEEGNPISLTVKVDMIKVVPGYVGGESRMYLMTDKQTGASLKVFTTSKKFQPKEGEDIAIEADVKKHDSHQGSKTTLIKNIKII